MSEPKFSFYDNVSRCELLDPDTHELIVGEAYCMPEDADMMSQKTGCDIALYKATAKLFRNKQKRLKKEKKVLEDLYKVYQGRPDYDQADPYVRILRKKIHSYQSDIALISDCESACHKDLEKYIQDKDKFYQQIRNHRKSDQ